MAAVHHLLFCCTLISTTHDEHDDVVAKNSVGIDAVVLMI